MEKTLNKEVSNEGLLNKNFNILIIGSFVSSLGMIMATFGITLQILDETESIFMSALSFSIGMIPQLFSSSLFGPFIDTHSRKYIIIFCDLSITLILLIGGFVFLNFEFNYIFAVSLSFIIGFIESIYKTSYDTLFPQTIKKGNFQKAYSISSLVFPLSRILMAPIGVLMYDKLGLGYMFLISSSAFFVVAMLEFFIRIKEIYEEKDRFNYIEGMKQGIFYVKRDKGLSTIFKRFFVSSMTWNAIVIVLVPYFKFHPELTMDHYVYTVTAMTTGRIIGGFAHIFIKFPVNKRLNIALTVYFIVDIISISTFYYPFEILLATRFLQGFLAVTSFNIRMSSVQAYLPNDVRGRVNALFNLNTMSASILGVLIAGLLVDYTSVTIELIPVIFCSISLISFFLIVFRNRKHVGVIYNTKV